MSELTDKYTKNFSTAKRKAFEKRVFENLGNMSELSAILRIILLRQFNWRNKWQKSIKLYPTR